MDKRIQLRHPGARNQIGAILMMVLLVMVLLLSITGLYLRAMHQDIERLSEAAQMARARLIFDRTQAMVLTRLLSVAHPPVAWLSGRRVISGWVVDWVVQPMQDRLNMNYWVGASGGSAEDKRHLRSLYQSCGLSRVGADQAVKDSLSWPVAVPVGDKSSPLCLIPSPPLQQLIDLRVLPALTQSAWFSLEEKATVIPGETALILDPRLVRPAVLQLLGASAIDRVRWRNCVAKHSMSQWGAISHDCLPSLPTQSLWPVQWQENRNYRLTMTIHQGHFRRALQRFIRIDQSHRHWRLVWQQMGIIHALRRPK